MIYAAGNQSSIASGAGGTVPSGIAPSPLAAYVFFSSVTGSLTCASPEGCVMLNLGTGDNLNNPDGVGSAQPQSSETGAGSISGLVAPNAGYLVGVFVAAGGPSRPAPPSLDFTSGRGTAFSTLALALDQVFFIGDGSSNNYCYPVQDFCVPPGATELHLGISGA